MLDNREVQEVMEILEGLEDEELAAQLLKKFNDRTKELGQLVMNLDPSIGHEQWKKECDQAQKKVDEVLEEIFSYR